jgi:hypothetical protein
MAGAVNELRELDSRDNQDMIVAVSLKNAVYIALLFSPAWVALGGMFLLELVWFFIADKIHNSKMELYFPDALLYDGRVRKGGQGRCHRKPSCRASIMAESLKASEPFGAFTLEGKTFEPFEGFKSIKQVRAFIAENYSTYSHAFQAAQLSELSRIKAALFGYDVTHVSNRLIIPVSAHGATFHVSVNHKAELSKALYDGAEAIWLTYDKAETGAYETRYEEMPKLQSYDLIAHLINRSDEFGKLLANMDFDGKSSREQSIILNRIDRKTLLEEMLKNVHLIVVTEHAVVKYAVRFNITTDGANADLYIDHCVNAALSDEDNKAIGKDTDA